MKKDCTAEEIMEQLQAPFSTSDIEWRVSHSGVSNGKPWAMVLAYVTNRAIQTRLDDVFGPAGWKNRYDDFKDGIICTISCLIEGQWVEKADGAEQTDIESLKGGLSNSMKRAAVQWGIGRYLYKLEAMFVEVFKDKRQGAIRIYDKKNNVEGYWFPPKLPNWALPKNEQGKGTSNPKPQSNQSSNQGNQKQQQTSSNQKQQSGSSSKPNTGQSNQKSGDSPEVRRQAVVNSIIEFMSNTGLKDNPKYIMPLFKLINPNLKEQDIAATLKNASIEDLKLYYFGLRPVHDLIELTKTFKVSIEDTLKYAQILLPQVNIENTFNLFTHLKVEHVKEISQFIREDLKSGNLQKIA